MIRFLATTAAVSAFLALGGAETLWAKDFLLTGVKPDKLVVVDPAARKVHKTHTIPNAAPGPVTITPSPDGKIAYVIVNRWESVSGIDLDSGEEVFRADLSSETERSKIMFGMDISPDGKTLAVYESPVKLHLGEYEVLPTRISFFDTSAGKGAKRVRSIPAPRQITILMYAEDGSKLYGMGRALYVIDPATGDVIKEHKTQAWERSEFYPPDILDVWSQWEQTGVFSTPYYTARTDVSLDDPAAYWTGLLTLDLKTGDFKLKEVENTDIFYFSTVVSPTNRDLVYGVYNNLSKLDAAQGKSLGRVELDHSYYAVNISSDGKEIYLGGTMSDIPVYDAETLKKLGQIEMPDGANQALAALRVIQR
ncbi:MAG: quinohemoprotein amine dehydrogenase subunit beta [Alphaproteobacteria bacterium]|nr:quinohemoprotein amine dehydrogenase subunit beta [Alphaproteobacteria bacterium]